MSPNVVVIGICGVTCGGKTTIANKLNKILPSSKIISQDDYFLEVNDPRHEWMENLNHINFDIVSSLDMEKMHCDINNFLKNKTLVTNQNTSKQNFTLKMDCDLYKSIHNKILESNTEVLIVEGFCIFNYKSIQHLFTFKYYLLLSYDECFKRRSKRVYVPPNCPQYFEKCAWPQHLIQLDEVKEQMQNVIYFDEYTEDPSEQILRDLLCMF